MTDKHIGSNFDDFLKEEGIEYKNDGEIAKNILHKATSFDLFEEVLEKAKSINLAKIEDNYHLDFGGYCGVKAPTLFQTFVLALQKINDFKGFENE